METSREVGGELAPRTHFFRKSEPLMMAEILHFLHYQSPWDPSILIGT